MSRELATMKRRTTRMAGCFERMPKYFNVDDALVVFGHKDRKSLSALLCRLMNDKFIKRNNPGEHPAIYEKLKNELL
jgi:hypothetical protein